MKRLCLLLVLLLALPACGAAEPGGHPESPGIKEPAGETIVFTDDLGQEFAIEPPRRTAALIGSFADIWCLAGGRDTLAAAAGDAWTSFDLGLREDTVNLGAVKEPNLEALLAAEPDLILASVNTAADLELKDTFAQAGLAAAYFEVDCFDDYLRMLEICTRLTGQTERYETCGTSVRAQVDAAIARQDGSAPRVLYVRASGSSCKAKGSEGSVLGEMLADLGCVNIADGGGLLENLSLEGILAGDPDYIFAVLQGADAAAAQKSLDAALLLNPAWSGLRAVQEGRFITLDHRLYNLKPNARWGDAYEGLADILYPN
ncbi:MAG: ABC transporter substrate-binding protein [Oscillibacter sp.]|nr:ABC transporter substrate-binding protein [Oscillibacter sp.]